MTLTITGCFSSKNEDVKMHEIKDKKILEIFEKDLNLAMSYQQSHDKTFYVALIKYEIDKTIYISFPENRIEERTYSVGPDYPNDIEKLQFKDGYGRNKYTVKNGKLYSRSDQIQSEKYPSDIKKEFELYLKIVRDVKVEMDKKEKSWASREK